MSLPRVLILDDDPKRHDAFERMIKDAKITRAYTAPQAVQLLRKRPTFDLVFLDHDLPMSSELVGVADPGCGLQVAAFIAENPGCRPRRVWIHTWNNTARVKMARMLRSAGIDVTLQKFHATSRLSIPCQT